MKKSSVLTFLPLAIEVKSDIIRVIPAGCLGKFQFKHDNHIYQLLFRFSYTPYELDLMKDVKWVNLCVRTQELMNNIKSKNLPVIDTFKEGVENMYADALRIGSSKDVLLKQIPMIQKNGHLLHNYVISLDISIRDVMLKSDYVSHTWLI